MPWFRSIELIVLAFWSVAKFQNIVGYNWNIYLTRGGRLVSTHKNKNRLHPHPLLRPWNPYKLGRRRAGGFKFIEIPGRLKKRNLKP